MSKLRTTIDTVLVLGLVALTSNLFCGCVDDAEARRPRAARRPQAPTAAPSNVVQEYSWDLEYWGSDFAGATWPVRSGAANTLAAFGTQATGDQSTSGLTSSGLPSALVNKGVLGVAGSNAYRLASTARWVHSGTSSDFIHVRLIFRVAASPTTNQRLFRFLESGTSFTEVNFTGTTQLTAFMRDDGDGGTAGGLSITASGVTADGWKLVDVAFERTAASGNMRITMFGNNVSEAGPTADDGPQFTDSPGSFALLGDHAGANTGNSTMLFFGARVTGSVFTLAEHQAAAAKLGLSGGL